jgi:hypothetical protein
MLADGLLGPFVGGAIAKDVQPFSGAFHPSQRPVSLDPLHISHQPFSLRVCFNIFHYACILFARLDNIRQSPLCSTYHSFAVGVDWGGAGKQPHCPRVGDMFRSLGRLRDVPGYGERETPDSVATVVHLNSSTSSTSQLLEGRGGARAVDVDSAAEPVADIPLVVDGAAVIPTRRLTAYLQ